jgi:hypothetical protein
MLLNINLIETPVSLRLGLSFVAVLLIPGYMLVNLFYANNDFEAHEKLAVDLLFSLILLSVSVAVSYIFSFKIEIFIWISFGLAALFTLADLILEFPKKRTHNLKFSFKIDRLKLSWTMVRSIIIFGLAGLLACLAYKVGTLLAGDSQVHIAMIRKMITNGVSSQNPFFKDLGIFSTYAYSFWQPALALVSKLAQADPYYLWQKLPIFLSPFILFAGYFFARNLFKNRNVAFVSIVVIFYFFFFVEFVRGNTWDMRTLIYPRNIDLFILLPLFFGWFMKYFYTLDKRSLAVAIVTALLIIAVHMFYYMLLVLALVAFLVVYFLITRDKTGSKSIIWTLILIVLVAVPYFILRQKTGLISGEILNAHNALSLARGDMINLPHGLLITNFRFLYPGKVMWGSTSLIALVTYFVLTPFLFIWFRKKPWAIFLISLILITPFICFNPFLVYLLGKFSGLPKVARIYQIAPIFYVVGFFLWWFFNQFKKIIANRAFRRSAFLAGLIFLVFIFLPYNVFLDRISPKSLRIQEQKYLTQDVIKFLNTLPQNSVVSADFQASRNVPTYSSLYVVCINNFYNFWGHKIIDPRIDDQKAILDPQVSNAATISLLNKYDVDYILVKNQETKKFQNKRFFTKIFIDNKYSIFARAEKI